MKEKISGMVGRGPTPDDTEKEAILMNDAEQDMQEEEQEIVAAEADPMPDSSGSAVDSTSVEDNPGLFKRASKAVNEYIKRKQHKEDEYNMQKEAEN